MEGNAALSAQGHAVVFPPSSGFLSGLLAVRSVTLPEPDHVLHSWGFTGRRKPPQSEREKEQRGVPLRPQSMAAHAAPAWCKHTRTCSGRTRSSRFFWGRFGGKPSRDSLHTSQGGRSAQRSKQCSNFKLQRLEEYQEGHGFKLWRV